MVASSLQTYHVPEMRRVAHIHFVGIGGAGMCGIAEVLLNQGYKISGSDLTVSPTIQRLKSLGATIAEFHNAELIANCDVVVVSSAIKNNNVEVVEAHVQHVPVIKRAEMLGELMRYRHGIAVAGTHGKTTTTSLITAIFQTANLDPTFVIGGLLNSAGTNAKLGASRYIIVEADESDASFLHLQPMIAVLTNVDQDHMSTYDNDFERLQATFVEFIHRLPFYGLAVVCIDDENIRRMLDDISRPIVTYGLSEGADYRAVNLRVERDQAIFVAERPGALQNLEIRLSLPGKHNVLNALAAIAIASDEKVADEAIIAGLAEFAGVDRRFEMTKNLVAQGNTYTLVDDYGHHPTEVAAVIDTVRSLWPDKRLVMAYQPHRYTRTRDLYDDFVKVLSTVDILVMFEVYSAGEVAISGADARSLCQGVRQLGRNNPVLAGSAEEGEEILVSLIEEGDIVVVQGAGNISLLSKSLLFNKKSKNKSEEQSENEV